MGIDPARSSLEPPSAPTEPATRPPDTPETDLAPPALGDDRQAAAEAWKAQLPEGTEGTEERQHARVVPLAGREFNTAPGSRPCGARARASRTTPGSPDRRPRRRSVRAPDPGGRPPEHLLARTLVAPSGTGVVHPRCGRSPARHARRGPRCQARARAGRRARPTFAQDGRLRRRQGWRRLHHDRRSASARPSWRCARTTPLWSSLSSRARRPSGVPRGPGSPAPSARCLARGGSAPSRRARADGLRARRRLGMERCAAPQRRRAAARPPPAGHAFTLLDVGDDAGERPRCAGTGRPGGRRDRGRPIRSGGRPVGTSNGSRPRPVRRGSAVYVVVCTRDEPYREVLHRAQDQLGVARCPARRGPAGSLPAAGHAYDPRRCCVPRRARRCCGSPRAGPRHGRPAAGAIVTEPPRATGTDRPAGPQPRPAMQNTPAQRRALRPRGRRHAAPPAAVRAAARVAAYVARAPPDLARAGGRHPAVAVIALALSVTEAFRETEETDEEEGTAPQIVQPAGRRQDNCRHSPDSVPEVLLGRDRATTCNCPASWSPGRPGCPPVDDDPHLGPERRTAMSTATSSKPRTRGHRLAAPGSRRPGSPVRR